MTSQQAMNQNTMNQVAMTSQALQPDLEYQQFLQAGRFMIQRGRSSGRHHFYPRAIEPGTGRDDLEWVAASGLGTVYSVTVVRSKPPALPYNVALIDLAEGPRLMSRVEGIAPDAVSIGMAVRARIVKEDGNAFVVFDPVLNQGNLS
jgi:uncharacterized protein